MWATMSRRPLVASWAMAVSSPEARPGRGAGARRAAPVSATAAQRPPAVPSRGGARLLPGEDVAGAAQRLARAAPVAGEPFGQAEVVEHARVTAVELRGPAGVAQR